MQAFLFDALYQHSIFRQEEYDFFLIAVHALITLNCIHGILSHHKIYQYHITYTHGRSWAFRQSQCGKNSQYHEGSERPDT